MLLAMGVALHPSVVRAQTTPSLRLSGNVGANAALSSPPGRTFNTTSPLPITLPETTVIADDTPHTGVATVSAVGSYGKLVGRLSASTTAGDPFGTGTAAGSLLLSWNDRMTVTGPPGTQVQFRVRLAFHGSLTTAPAGSCLNAASLSAGASIGVNGSTNMNVFRGQPGCAQIGGDDEQTRTFSAAVGTSFPVTGTVNTLVTSLSLVSGGPSPAPVRSAHATVDLTQGIAFSVEVLTAGGGYTTVSGARYDGLPRVALTGVPTTARAGDSLTIGLEAGNPSDGEELDLYVGAILSDGHTVLFLNTLGQFIGVGLLSLPASFVPMQVLPPGSGVNNAALLAMTVPAASALPPGTYTLFAALVRRGVLADGVLGPGDLVALVARPLTILP